MKEPNERPAERPTVPFAVRAGDVVRVALFLPESAAEIPLRRHRDGLWHTRLSLSPGRHRYRVLVDGRPWWPAGEPAGRDGVLVVD